MSILAVYNNNIEQAIEYIIRLEQSYEIWSPKPTRTESQQISEAKEDVTNPTNENQPSTFSPRQEGSQPTTTKGESTKSEPINAGSRGSDLDMVVNPEMQRTHQQKLQEIEVFFSLVLEYDGHGIEGWHRRILVSHSTSFHENSIQLD